MRRLFLVVTSLVCILPLGHAEWRGFRGDGSAVSPEKGLPTTLSKDTLQWKVKLPGPGASSPIVVGDRILLTCYSGYGNKLTEGFKSGDAFAKGKEEGDQKNLRLHVLCLDAKKGGTLWEKIIEPRLPEAPFVSFLREHGYASSTPVSDGQNVYVFFGKTGVFCFDLDGKQVWHESVGEGTHEWGSAASPVLTKNAVIVNASIEGKALIALDRKTGKEIWRKKDVPICWVSPVVVNLDGGKQEIVFNAPGRISGLDPEKGTELWHCQGLGGGGIAGATCSTPAVQGDRAYIMSAGPATPPTLLAVRAGGRGDVTKTHLLWKQKVGAGICSPVAREGRVYFIDGMAHCLEADTGKIVYKERLYDARGEYASPVVADGRLYMLTRFDGLFVLPEGDTFKELARNEFTGDRSIFNSTPAVSGGRIYLRSNAFLYGVGKK